MAHQYYKDNGADFVANPVGRVCLGSLVAMHVVITGGIAVLLWKDKLLGQLHLASALVVNVLVEILCTLSIFGQRLFRMGLFMCVMLISCLLFTVAMFHVRAPDLEFYLALGSSIVTVSYLELGHALI